MFNLRDLQLNKQHRENLESQAENWRKAKKKKTYQPNPALKRNRRNR